MPPAPLPHDEVARLRLITQLGSLEGLRDVELDALTGKLAHALRVPTAVVSLVDDRRQVFVSRFGMPFAETPREQSFCAHAILAADPLICSDATQDLRFADNPLVTGEPGIRFYAGAPVLAPDGHAMGTLCAIDYRPRRLTDREMLALRRLATAVTGRLAVWHALNDGAMASLRR